MANEEEMKTAIHKTELDICPDDRPGLDPVRPLAHIIAEMIERSHWAHSGIAFEVSPGVGHVFFKLGVSSVCVSGYNLAYQVKLCVDLFSSCGYFM